LLSYLAYTFHTRSQEAMTVELPSITNTIVHWHTHISHYILTWTVQLNGESTGSRIKSPQRLSSGVAETFLDWRDEVIVHLCCKTGNTVPFWCENYNIIDFHTSFWMYMFWKWTSTLYKLIIWTFKTKMYYYILRVHSS